MTTDWLPGLVLLECSGGDWKMYVECLHGHFENDFVHSAPSWPGKRVGLKRHPEYLGKSATFWHFISEGPEEAERYPDLRRCERIRWPRPIMEDFGDTIPDAATCRVVWWRNERRGESRYVLALEDFSYVVIVADRERYVLPWTAYYVERKHQRDKLRKEFDAYWLARKG